MRPFDVELGFSAVQPHLRASVRPALDAQPYPSEFVRYSAALTKPAMTRQTRYILSRSEFFASNRADQARAPRIAVSRDVDGKSRDPEVHGSVRAALRVTVLPEVLDQPLFGLGAMACRACPAGPRSMTVAF